MAADAMVCWKATAGGDLILVAVAVDPPPCVALAVGLVVVVPSGAVTEPFDTGVVVRLLFNDDEADTIALDVFALLEALSSSSF